jgi:beta-fructofuranosidase
MRLVVLLFIKYLKMKKIILIGILFIAIVVLKAQDFNPAVQQTTNMQYFKPTGENYFAGDPMPFWHDGTFHLFWLWDENHASHGHDWAHMSTTDLINWKHYPLALKRDKPFENSMCTGSIIFYDKKYYAFYATRIINDKGQTEHVSFAISDDGIHFIKQEPNVLIFAPDEYESSNFRDPNVFYDDSTKLFYMLVTTALKKAELEKDRYGLLCYTSSDLKNWKLKGPFYMTGSDKGFAYSECSDLFKWNGWYYLIFKIYGGTYYRMSRSISGPWMAPSNDNLANDYTMVLKTAAFKNNRRIAVGFVPSRGDNKDNGVWTYAGNLVFREVIQNANGTLSAVFPTEMIPDMESTYKYPGLKTEYNLKSPDKFSYTKLENIPLNAKITCTVVPNGINTSVGMLLRHSEKGFYELNIDAIANKVSLGNNSIERVLGLDKPFSLEIIIKNDIIDVCIAGKRCLLNRCPEQKGTSLYLFVHNGEAIFKNLTVEKIKE